MLSRNKPFRSTNPLPCNHLAQLSRLPSVFGAQKLSIVVDTVSCVRDNI